ncbi:MAG: DUF808 domain-containing protein [Actinomyces sp.]|nr:MAG: DUF808 domain-containing protein [Actinomyces sp.]
MAAGLVGLLDDVASLAKLAASSIDDVGAAAGRATAKTAGVVVDDTAVTPAYVHGLAAERELPIVGRIAKGSLRNKLVFILPVALALSEWAPTLVEALLLLGGGYLSYEGAHKILHAWRHDDTDHEVPAAVRGPDAEEQTVASAVRTDFILSSEIMVIALKEVLDEGLVARAAILVVVAVVITVAVYGVVALIVKMDDVGLALAQGAAGLRARVGRGLVRAMPRLLAVLATVGTAAMVWVGGHICVSASDELGWHGPADVIHELEGAVPGHGTVAGVAAWLVDTMAAALVGLAVGLVLVGIVAAVGSRRRPV